MLVSVVLQSHRCPIMGKIWMKEVHIEYWMQTKEGWSVEL
jgi:hypothetical protein